MREVTVKLYNYDELPTEKAKKKARAWWIDAASDDDWHEYTYADAAEIGFYITDWDIYRGNYVKGHFNDGAFNCAEAIIANHGKDTNTYKAAEAYIAGFERSTEEDEDRTDALDAIEGDFLDSLCDSYLTMLNEAYEYYYGDEHVAETIQANEYEFLESGERF